MTVRLRNFLGFKHQSDTYSNWFWHILAIFCTLRSKSLSPYSTNVSQTISWRTSDKSWWKNHCEREYQLTIFFQTLWKMRMDMMWIQKGMIYFIKTCHGRVAVRNLTVKDINLSQAAGSYSVEHEIPIVMQYWSSQSSSQSPVQSSSHLFPYDPFQYYTFAYV
jgi:hypothetical protein